MIIKDIETYFPYYNKKVLSSYNECYQYVKNQLIDEEIKYTSYDYAINIWLLGEYGNEDSLLILNITNDIEDILEDLEKRSFKEQRVNIFIEWIKDNRGYNILDRIENIRKEYKENYPTYPIDIITYISS